MSITKAHQRLLEANAMANAEECDRLRAINADLIAALKIMIAEKVDYMLTNHLGDPDKQQTVIYGRAALRKAGAAP